MSDSVYDRLLPPWEQLSLQQQVAQLLVVRTSGHLFDHQIRYPQWEAPAAQLRHWIEDLGVGGVILLGGSMAELAIRIQQMQCWSQVPLLVTADVEQGVGQRFAGATWMPPPLALGAIAPFDLPQACAHARVMGAITAQEAQAVGLNWLLAPIVDVNNNPDNPVISLRAFGETPEGVIPLIEAFIQGAQQYGVLTTAKHFPGHGDTATDPHLDLPLIPHSRQRLEQVELAPFRAAIAAGVNAVMTAHLQIPALDPTYPATLSPAILTQLLRQELGFDGLIVTDALVMQAITRHYGAYEAPIMALAAGADIILMPVDPPGTIAAICDAVQTGRLSQERLHASLTRIWQAKQQVLRATASATVRSEGDRGIGESAPPWVKQVARPQAFDQCRTILEQSLILHPPPMKELQPGRSPSDPAAPPATNLILVENLLQADFLGMHTPAVRIPQSWGYCLQWVDRQTPALEPPRELPPTLLQLFIQANPFQDMSGLVAIAQRWLEALLAAGRLEALILYGSPYVWQTLLPQLPADLPAVFSYGQIPLAQAIALEKLLALGWAAPNRGNIDQQFTT
ncbi:MAG: glycoside hydrolase family 3 N-terminal domain-containing protein [Synechococcales bacterium]|nr:glycoside hydrolase family 3 N-terminal domain-containing protein [Synechococcales bacterium]